MRIKIISAITALCMSATVIGVALTANGKGNGVTPSQSQTTVTGSASSSTALNVIKYGDKLTQDQVMSQIKAQYLIENGGYKDTPSRSQEKFRNPTSSKNRTRLFPLFRQAD